MVQTSLQEISLKEVHEPFSSNSRGPIHEDRRLQIEELDEWQTHKPRTPDKPNLRQNKLNTFPNQLKVRDRVLLDAANPHIVASTPNEEIPLTVLSIFPFGTVEVSHPKFGTFKEISLKEVHEPFSSNSRGPIHEDRRLQIEELDEWQTHKPRTPDKPNLRQNKLNTFPNQLKVRDRVLLDAANPHIVASTPNEEIPLTVLSIFPFGTVEVSHPKFGTFKVTTPI
ncbi:hypothetical protein GOBAR_AA09341 [Gossypium barbadense]|uniref:Uncharacterized protein n=1 Tax=Gossypium barbadense TaxID=3634 RepID=A0A2P5Y6S8_GOSBA|nr:hypothetical protein GOBAR_AA09341 [Gossypium barbadense]